MFKIKGELVIVPAPLCLLTAGEQRLMLTLSHHYEIADPPASYPRNQGR